MSDTEEVPELSAEAKAFLGKHQATGEPSAEGLERGQQRIASLARGAPLRRRPLLPPEVMAAAAVVTLLLGAQGLYLVLRTPPVPVPQTQPEPVAAFPSGEAEVNAISAAWSAGDLDTAGRLASKHCQSAACRPLATELSRALGLAARVEKLAIPELDELASFDAKLSSGKKSVVQEMVAQRRLALVGTNELSRLTLAVGASGQVATDRDISRLAIGDPDVADVSVDGARMIRVKGMSAGKTTLLVWFTKGPRVSVEVEILEQGPSNQTLALHVAQLEAEPDVPADVKVVPAQVAESTVQLTVGDVTDLKLKGKITRLAVGDPQVADVSVSSGDIRVEARGKGRTTLMVWFSDGLRQSLVLDVKPPEAKEELVQLAVGGSMTFSARRPMRKFTGADPGVANVRMLSKQELRIEGVRAGKTRVLITYEGDARAAVNIEVTSNRDSEVAELFARALKAKSNNDMPTAFTLVREVLRLDPHHDAAQLLLGSFRTEARQLYLRGYQLRETSPDQARGFFQRVVDITPSDDEMHQKATSRLSELQQQ